MKSAGKDVSFSDESHEDDQSFFAYSACIEIGNKKYVGFGQSNNKDEAIYIAIMELVERYVLDTYENTKFFKLKRTGLLSNYKVFRNYTVSDDRLHLSNSNGLAVHTSSRKAIENSLNEIVERHVVIKALCSDQVPCSTSVDLKSLVN